MRTVATILGTLFVGTVPLLAQVPPAGVAGTWEVEDTPFSIVLDVKDGAVSRQLVQNANKTAIAEGTVSGDTVTFRATSPDGARTVTFVGKLTGDEMLFTREVEMREGAPLGGAGLMGANGPTEFRARRASPASEVWTGTVRNAPTPRNQSPNPNPRPVTLSTRKMPDPHWRWRGGEKDIDVRIFAFGNQTLTVSAYDLSGDRLTFSASRPGPGDEIECDLTRRSEGDFAGRCQATAGAGPNLLIELAPPGQPAPETMR
jgi:hypothetical protein